MTRSRSSARAAGARTERAVADYLAAELDDDRIDEQWKPIAGYEGYYEVSNHGRVRSVDRVVPRKGLPQRLQGKILSQGVRRDGKRMVSLTRESRGRTLLVHRLVLFAFCGPPGPNQECCHRDDDGSNNHVDNLYWGTRSENLYDAVRNGRHWQAKKTHCKNGHEFTPDTTAYDLHGRRQCRPCRVLKSRMRRAGRKVASS